ncbi:unnamed protein product, partial [marine sediment metagenome]
DGFGWAVLGGGVISIVSMILEGMLGLREEEEEGET